ncbi:hypothetical protein JCM33374_g4443 [Metschnikowia sp. JCM 33374]|nr:hypothetical protein JCM33374_g4443 [Metschnikowia sp. JCM 33374]
MLRVLLLALGLTLVLYYTSESIPGTQAIKSAFEGINRPRSGQQVQKRPLKFSQLNFLHTTDTHGWLSGHLNQKTYNGDWGDFVSFAQHVKKQAHDRNQDFLLVDTGDRHDGNGLSDITAPNGARSLPIFTQADFDLVTLGNHELYLWENSEQELDLLVPRYGDNYVCSNVEYQTSQNGSDVFVPFSRRFRYFTTPQQKLRVLSFGFLFDFNRANKRTKVTPIETAVAQQWFKDVLAAYPPSEVDVIVVAGHIPVTRRWTELQLLHTTLRSAYPHTVIQYFGGHSHVRDFQVFDDHSTALQSGRFCETLGFLSIDLSPAVASVEDRFFRSYIDFSVDSFMFHAQKSSWKEFHTQKGSVVKHMLASAREDLHLDDVLGHVEESNYYMDYVPLTHPKNLYNLLTSRVLPTLQPNDAEAQKNASDQRIIIINTGSVRYDLYKGPYTVDSHFIVSPFQNNWVKLRVPKEIAIRIAPKLNENDYILSDAAQGAHNSNVYLRPPHQRYHYVEERDPDQQGQIPLAYPDLAGEVDVKGQLPKGYVTYDDFGHSGDDTPHRAVKHYPIPNVVQSLELKPGLEGTVDVVFYSFLIPNVVATVEALGGTASPIEFYSDKYLGLLLDQYVAEHRV